MNHQYSKKVVIDFLPESAARYRDDFAIIAIDVIRATTTAITAVARGHRCFPISSLDKAFMLAKILDRPLLVGELGGNMPYGFHFNNSPAEINEQNDVDRPVILLSSAGTPLIEESSSAAAMYLACFRNFHSTARYVSSLHSSVAVLGAGTRGEFREEDQMCCAWIAEILMSYGFSPLDTQTSQIINRWRGTPIEACLVSKSVEYLRRSGQLKDLEFIMSHVNDIDAVFGMENGEVVMLPRSSRPQAPGSSDVRLRLA